MDQDREDYRDRPELEGDVHLSAPLFWLAVSPLALFILAVLGLVASVYLGIIGE